MKEFEKNNLEMLTLIDHWECILLSLEEDSITNYMNSQNRTIKQILGHMVDSATNNSHRIIHLQYQPSPIYYPDYANLGNNDRWIAIQDYQHENWHNLVQLWKYSNLHIVHIIQNIDLSKLNQYWISATGNSISLKEMTIDYLRHFKLHLNEIDQLLLQRTT